MGQHQYRPAAPMARRARQVGVAHVDAVRLLWLRRACARVPAARPLRLDARWSRSRIAASRGVRQSRHFMPSRRSRVATRSSFGHPPRPRTRRYRAGSSSPTIGGCIHRLVAAEPDPARGSRFGLTGQASVAFRRPDAKAALLEWRRRCRCWSAAFEIGGLIALIQCAS
jgi:hypothetical protein